MAVPLWTITCYMTPLYHLKSYTSIFILILKAGEHVHDEGYLAHCRKPGYSSFSTCLSNTNLLQFVDFLLYII